MGSPINAVIDPQTDLRWYSFNEHKLMSATSLRRVLGMSFGLHHWAIGQVIDAAVAGRGTYADSMLNEDEYRKYLRKSSQSKRDEAAALGTSVHEAAELGVRSVLLAEEDPRKPFLLQYEKALAALDIEVLLAESQVFNLTLGYAGSLDFIGRCRSPLPEYGLQRGEVVLTDIKTGKGVYNDHALQLALYFGAEFVGGFDPQEDKDVVYEDATDILKDSTASAILHLRPETWEFIPVPITDQLAAAAVDLVRLARWFAEHPTLDTLKGATP
jgi:hypothetical protein